MLLATEKVTVKTNGGISRCHCEYYNMAKIFLTDVKMEEFGILCSVREVYQPQGGFSLAPQKAKHIYTIY